MNPNGVKQIDKNDIIKHVEKGETYIFSTKIQKITKYNWKKEKIIAFTNKRILLFKGKLLQRKIKSIMIDAVTKSTHKESLEFVLHLQTDHDYRFSTTVREEIINLINYLYAMNKKNPLPIYEVPDLELKAYVTTKHDKTIHKNRTPNESFRKQSNGEIIPKKEHLPELVKSSSLILSKQNSNQVNLNSFKIIQQVGKGSYGRVF